MTANPKPDAVNEFQRRRRAWIRRAKPPLVLAFLCLFVSLAMVASRKGAYATIALGLAFACVLVALYFTLRLFRCPECNAVQGARSRDMSVRGFEDDPEYCIHCGARLRAADSPAVRVE